MQRNEHNWPLITVIGDPLCICTVADWLDGPQSPGYLRHAGASLPERADRPELARDPFASGRARRQTPWTAAISTKLTQSPHATHSFLVRAEDAASLVAIRGGGSAGKANKPITQMQHNDRNPIHPALTDPVRGGADPSYGSCPTAESSPATVAIHRRQSVPCRF